MKGIQNKQFETPLYTERAKKPTSHEVHILDHDCNGREIWETINIPITEKVSECCSAGFADETFGIVCANCGEPTGVVNLADEYFGRNVPTDANGMIQI